MRKNVDSATETPHARHGNLETRRLGDTPGHTTCRVPVCMCGHAGDTGSVCSLISDAAFFGIFGCDVAIVVSGMVSFTGAVDESMLLAQPPFFDVSWRAADRARMCVSLLLCPENCAV